jgi:hypothetical protein
MHDSDIFPKTRFTKIMLHIPTHTLIVNMTVKFCFYPARFSEENEASKGF